MVPREPWKQLRNEGDKPYDYFFRYMSVPTPRPSLQAFANNIGKSMSMLKSYSSKFDWVERANAFDQRTRDVVEEVTLTEAETIRKEQLQALRMCRVLGTIALSDHLKKAKAGKIDVNVREALALIRDTTTLERLVIGEATERVENRELDVDVSKLSGEEAEQLLGLLAKLETE